MLLDSLTQQALIQRRSRLAKLHSQPILLWSGGPLARNFRANHYPFRASSHFLYFAGLPLMNAVLCLENQRTTLFWDEPEAGEELWHGAMPSATDIGAAIQVDQVVSFQALAQWQGESFSTILSQDATARLHQGQLGAQETDTALAEAIITLRLQHDEAAIAQIKGAVSVTVKAHKAGLRATPEATQESEVRAAIESVFMAHNMTPAYGSIVTTHGEVLHNQSYHHQFKAGDLLLVDAGAETAGGWASDVTRTWPVSGKFSASQRAIYDVVLAAHDTAIDALHIGQEYRQIHHIASQVITEGLVDLKILQGDVNSLMEQDIQAYFFPHGVGHILGLDVHDMEDLGDQAGYAAGRQRSDRMGWCFLRLDRPLQDNMVVTIEPGFYQIPALLRQAKEKEQINACINWDRLAEFQDVKGIRIEDDVQITEQGAVVLTEDLPTNGDRLCELMKH